MPVKHIQRKSYVSALQLFLTIHLTQVLTVNSAAVGYGQKVFRVYGQIQKSRLALILLIFGKFWRLKITVTDHEPLLSGCCKALVALVEKVYISITCLKRISYSLYFCCQNKDRNVGWKNRRLSARTTTITSQMQYACAFLPFYKFHVLLVQRYLLCNTTIISEQAVRSISCQVVNIYIPFNVRTSLRNMSFALEILNGQNW